MGISKLVGLAVRKAGNRVGLYSKKQSVEVATNIGKELVDLSKNETQITKDVIQSVIKKHVPKAKVNIITDKDEFAQVIKNAGGNPETIDLVTNSYAAMYFNISQGKAKGIFIPNLKTTQDMSNFAHEFEHYMYHEHTPKRKLFLTALRKFEKSTEKSKPLQSEPSKKAVYEQVAAEADIQDLLHRYFGIKHLALTGGLKDIKPTPEGVAELLRGKNFTGLTDEKRINAYIRTIIRNQMHPKNSENMPKLILTKITLDDEARAYGVSDAVTRYATGSGDITPFGLVSDIYTRTSRVLKNEIKTGMKYIGKSNTVEKNGFVYPHQKKTGLPSTSYCGEKYVDPLTAFLQQSSVEYGETIHIGDIINKKLKNAKKIKVSKTALEPYEPKVVNCGVFKKAGKQTDKT